MRIWTVALLLAGCTAVPLPLISQSTAMHAMTIRSSASGTVRVLYTFLGHKGYFPNGYGPSGYSVVNGQFVGTTSFGGRYGYGTLYTMTLSGKITTLYSFRGSPDGSGPAGGIVPYHGKWYGITRLGGLYGAGTVYSITPSGDERVIYSFQGGRDGALPESRPTLLDGTFYGTTLYGGNNDQDGTVYSVTPLGLEHVVHHFGSAEQDYATGPGAELTYVNGLFYGVAGSTKHGWGSIFTLSPSGAYRNVHYFTTEEGGGGSGLRLYNGMLYGTTSGEMSNHFRYHDGGVFEFNPASHALRMIARVGDLTGGGEPAGGVTLFDGAFYGASIYGDAYKDGGVFKVTPRGEVSLVYSFHRRPDGRRAGVGFAYNGKLYGGASWGGPNQRGGGTILELSP